MTRDARLHFVRFYDDNRTNVSQRVLARCLDRKRRIVEWLVSRRLGAVDEARVWFVIEDNLKKCPGGNPASP
ncbi:uncharacterized protein PHALS_14117 [Plasmopara halstedii]|uniref:Uncharacterized protein n=1 Tax=Plasmopara halstedii TaxID=4781 RepID=A0A0P1ASN6_PLAHL|nr:uncharacterized protein PHALS_14117 [Plasmopara halstedii]CEG43828.1 hypothetical protein PHALS_14117 [Plasmopara halstedii]|eukprot:XP_024580197.1 hypothetical protein PHALS_14117 [Plasmopara halstedii]